MRFLAIALFVTVTCASPAVKPTPPCERGVELNYEYVAKAFQGIPGTSHVQTGIKIYTTFSLKMVETSNLMELKINACQSTPLPLSQTVQQSQLCQDLIKYPLPFEMEGGRIFGLFPYKMEQKEVLNVKRGILSALQVSVDGKVNVRTVKEHDVLGECPTEISEVPTGDAMIVMKQRDTSKCSRCENNASMLFTPNLDQSAKFQFGQMAAQYKLDEDNIVVSANLTQYEEFAPLSKEAGRITSTITQELLLLKKKLLSCEPIVDISGRVNVTLKFDCDANCEADCKAEPSDIASLQSYKKTEEILKMLPLVVPHDVPEMFIKLIDQLRHLNKRDLQKLRTMLFKPRIEYTGTKLSKILFYGNIAKRQDFFMDALMFVHTDVAVEMIVDLAIDPLKQLTKARKVQMTLSLAATELKCLDPCKLLNATLKLASGNYRNETTTLVLGTVLGRIQTSRPGMCKTEKEEATFFLIKKLTDSIGSLSIDFELHDPMSKSQTELFKLAAHAIKALKNARSNKAIIELKKVVLTRRLPVELRVQALYALKEISVTAPILVRPIAVQVFMLRTESEELRIAAFNTFMHTIGGRFDLPLDLMLALRKFMLTEHNENVKSYFCSYVKALRQTEDPSLRKRRDSVFFLWTSINGFLTCKSADVSFFKSKSIRSYVSLADLPITRQLPRDVMGAGVTLTSVYNNASNIPREGAMKVKASMFGVDIELFEAGFHATGIEELIRQVFGPLGYIFRNTQETDVSGLPRNPEFEYDLPRENVSGSGYFKLLGQELLWEHIDEDIITDLMYDDNLTINKLRNLVTDARFEGMTYDLLYEKSLELIKFIRNGEMSLWNENLNFTKSVSFLDFKKVFPTIIGMPLNLNARAAGHLQLDAGAYLSYINKHPISSYLPTFFKNLFGYREEEKMLRAYGDIALKASVAMDVELVLDSCDYKPRISFFANATSNFTQHGVATLFPNFTTIVEILEVPEDDFMLLNVSYTPFTEVDGKKYILGIEKRNDTQIYEPVGAELVGIEVFSLVSYPNSSMVPMAPLFPLSGPASGNITLKLVNKNLTKLNFTAWNETKMTWSKGKFETTLNGVGLDRLINMSLAWNKTKLDNKRLFNFSVVSRPVNASLLFNVSSDDFNQISSFIGKLQINTTSINVSSLARANRTSFYSLVKSKRYIDDTVKALVKLPNFELLTYGSLKQKKYAKLMIKPFVEGLISKKHFVFVNATLEGAMMNATVTSSFFRVPELRFLNVDKISGNFKSPFPIFNPECHVFNGHFVMFDGLKYSYKLSSECEYVLARQRHLNDTFGITMVGKTVKVYINQVIYELTIDSTKLKVDGKWVELPYKKNLSIEVEKVTTGGKEYVHLKAFAGIEIFYNMGDVIISVDRFFANQTAGLCGNANSNGTYNDEIRKPSMEMATSLESFTESWIVADSSCTSHPRDEMLDHKSALFPGAVKTCIKLFNEVLGDGADVVVLAPFFNACIHEVSLGRQPGPIIEAYILAARTQSVSVKACEYAQWSEWSSCNKSEQFRRRVAAKSYVKSICLDQTQATICSDDFVINECSVVLKHLKVRFDSKLYQSVKKYPVCGDDCEAVYDTEQQKIVMRHVKSRKSPIAIDSDEITLYKKKLVKCQPFS